MTMRRRRGGKGKKESVLSMSSMPMTETMPKKLYEINSSDPYLVATASRVVGGTSDVDHRDGCCTGKGAGEGAGESDAAVRHRESASLEVTGG